jgi:hypothetical protein
MSFDITQHHARSVPEMPGLGSGDERLATADGRFGIPVSESCARARCRHLRVSSSTRGSQRVGRNKDRLDVDW